MPKPPPGPTREISSQQLYQIARAELLKDTTITNAEWKEQIYDRLVIFGFSYPRPDQLATAMDGVERQLAKEFGPRQVGPVAPPPVVRVKPDIPATPTRQEWAAMHATVAAIQARTVSALAAMILPPPREVLTVSEHAALDQFYAEAATGDRQGALRRFAEFAIAREPGWDVAAVRASCAVLTLTARACGCCGGRGRPLVWHHIIQIQHGGSNLLRNRVPLCDPCHMAVHPWLVKPLPVRFGWTSLDDLVATGVEALRTAAVKQETEHPDGDPRRFDTRRHDGSQRRKP
jgi:hypothetical protein